MDAFYASVEQRDNPELCGRPVVVGGSPESRGVVAACSYEAREFGIHSAMPSSRAAKLCPDVVFLPPRFDAYREASIKIHEVFRRHTDLIEPLSLDEAYLDVTQFSELTGSATEVALSIKREIKEAINLTASAGVSYNKFLAKIASDMDKPDGLYVIRPEVAAEFIEKLEIRKFYGIGKVTEKKMQALGIFVGADLKKLSKIQLQTQFGKSGDYYYNIARGVDERAVSNQRTRKSLGNETTFEENVRDKKQIWETLKRLSSKLAEMAEKRNLVARTLTLKVRYSDFQLITRSKTCETPLQRNEDILNILPELLKKTEAGKRPIRLIGVTFANFMTEDEYANEVTIGESEDGQVMENRQLGLFR
jgi:DNA polymerase-4